MGVSRYVAFLGGINVGGHGVTMDRLRIEALGKTSTARNVKSLRKLAEKLGH